MGRLQQLPPGSNRQGRVVAASVLPTYRQGMYGYYRVSKNSILGIYNYFSNITLKGTVERYSLKYINKYFVLEIHMKAI